MNSDEILAQYNSHSYNNISTTIMFLEGPMTEEQLQEVDEVVDLEEYARAGRKPPKAKQYRIRVDRDRFVVNVSQMTGRQILELAGKQPPERFRLDQKLHGGQAVKIELAEVVDFTTPGVERFMTLPLDQTEG
jgi:hypothetical protein